MATVKPTIVIISGGWHVPKSYAKFTTALRSLDYEVHVPELPTMNQARPPNADLSTDAGLIRAYVESLIDAGRTVVAVMHSYGGQVGTQALAGLGTTTRSERGLAGGVSHLVYVCAFAMPEGTSMMTKVREFGHEHHMPLAFDYADDGTVVPRDWRLLLVGEHADEAETQAYLDTLVRWNGHCMEQELTRCAWREVPLLYVHTTEDITVPLDKQQSIVAGVRAQGREVKTVELKSGHSPMLTNTKEVVDAIVDFVSSSA